MLCLHFTPILFHHVRTNAHTAQPSATASERFQTQFIRLHSARSVISMLTWNHITGEVGVVSMIFCVLSRSLNTQNYSLTALPWSFDFFPSCRPLSILSCSTGLFARQTCWRNSDFCCGALNCCSNYLLPYSNKRADFVATQYVREHC